MTEQTLPLPVELVLQHVDEPSNFKLEYLRQQYFRNDQMTCIREFSQVAHWSRHTQVRNQNGQDV